MSFGWGCYDEESVTRERADELLEAVLAAGDTAGDAVAAELNEVYGPWLRRRLDDW